MFSELEKTILPLTKLEISDERKVVLQALVNYIKDKRDSGLLVNLNFICTHNSRRSHLAQIWAQIGAAYYGIPQVHCYSGGTEATAMFVAIRKTLERQGFELFALSESKNSVYAVKYSSEAPPAIAFSKKYDHPVNPTSNYAAVMTCSDADTNCPVVIGSDKRIPVMYLDPKAYDDSPEQMQKYLEKSEEIGSEMLYVFKQVSEGSL